MIFAVKNAFCRGSRVKIVTGSFGVAVGIKNPIGLTFSLV
jgi:hypothetical protein